MAAKELVQKVWIEEGCIVCDACETAAPDVFEVTDDTCLIRPEALTADFTKPRTENIIDAAEECPVDVIKFDMVSQEVSDAEVATVTTAVAAAPAATSAPASAEPPKTAASKTPAPAAAVAAESKPAVAAKAPTAPGSEGDPAIQALLKAATARGGNAGILRKGESVPDAVAAWHRKDPSELPPDARQVKMIEAVRKARKDPNLQRRAFMSQAALGVGWVAFGTGTGITVGPAFARFMMPNVLEEPDPRIRVGKIQRYLEMVPGGVNEDYKSQGIWMIREQGRIAALNIICTHLGCIPNWLPNDRKFKCPCHGSGYKPNGVNFEGPTPRPLERFRILIDDGIVVVDKSKKYQHELGQWDQPGSFLEV